MSSILEIQLKVDQILQFIICLYEESQRCSDFTQIRHAVLNHYQEVLKYLNRSFEVINQQSPDFQIQAMSISELIKLNKTHALSAHVEVMTIHQMVKDLIIHLDELVFIVRNYSIQPSRFHTKLYAQAMTELFDLQNRYIYPYHPFLIAEGIK